MKPETEQKFKQAEQILKPEFDYIEEIRDFNQEKVLNAFLPLFKVSNTSKKKAILSNEFLKALGVMDGILAILRAYVLNGYKLSNDFLSIESNTEIILVSNKQIQLDNTDSNGFEALYKYDKDSNLIHRIAVI